MRDTLGHGDDGTLSTNISRSAQALDAAFEQFADLEGLSCILTPGILLVSPALCGQRISKRGPVGLLRKYRAPGPRQAIGTHTADQFLIDRHAAELETEFEFDGWQSALLPERR